MSFRSAISNDCSPIRVFDSCRRTSSQTISTDLGHPSRFSEKALSTPLLFPVRTVNSVTPDLLQIIDDDEADFNGSLSKLDHCLWNVDSTDDDAFMCGLTDETIVDFILDLNEACEREKSIVGNVPVHMRVNNKQPPDSNDYSTLKTARSKQTSVCGIGHYRKRLPTKRSGTSRHKSTVNRPSRREGNAVRRRRRSVRRTIDTEANDDVIASDRLGDTLQILHSMKNVTQKQDVTVADDDDECGVLMNSDERSVSANTAPLSATAGEFVAHNQQKSPVKTTPLQSSINYAKGHQGADNTETAMTAAVGDSLKVEMLNTGWLDAFLNEHGPKLVSADQKLLVDHLMPASAYEDDQRPTSKITTIERKSRKRLTTDERLIAEAVSDFSNLDGYNLRNRSLMKNIRRELMEPEHQISGEYYEMPASIGNEKFRRAASCDGNQTRKNTMLIKSVNLRAEIASRPASSIHTERKSRKRVTADERLIAEAVSDFSNLNGYNLRKRSLTNSTRYNTVDTANVDTTCDTQQEVDAIANVNVVAIKRSISRPSNRDGLFQFED